VAALWVAPIVEANRLETVVRSIADEVARELQLDRREGEGSR
jgi:hypothetical protein